jgi:hypothetical protein
MIIQLAIRLETFLLDIALPHNQTLVFAASCSISRFGSRATITSICCNPKSTSSFVFKRTTWESSLFLMLGIFFKIAQASHPINFYQHDVLLQTTTMSVLLHALSFAIKVHLLNLHCKYEKLNFYHPPSPSPVWPGFHPVT